jgi:copper(I)-binding protein
VNRALRAAAMGVLLLSPVVLSACSAGQVTQTESQVRDKTGAQARVGDILIRQAQLLSPRGGSYERGDDADLQVTFVNGGAEDDTLVGIEGDGFGTAEIENASTGSATSSASPGSSQELEIPAGSSVFVGDDDADATVTLTDLDEGITVGQYIEVTFVFEKAGEVTLPISVANPSEEDRGEAFDFHEEEGAEEG